MTNRDENQGGKQEEQPYIAPRRTPHPDETPISPYDPREIDELDHTSHKRPLSMVAQNIRSTEAQLKNHLSQLGISTGKDMRKATINPNRMMTTQPMMVPTARRAKTAQQNLESYYQRFATLCEDHLAEAANKSNNSDQE